MSIYVNGKKVGLMLKGTGNDTIPEFGEYDLPEVLQNATATYTMQLSNGDVLLSNNIADAGLWLFNFNTKEFSKIYESYDWKHFQIIGEDCLVVGRGGFVLYESITRTARLLHSVNAGNLTGFFVVGEDCIMPGWATSASSGFFVYDGSTKTISRHTFSNGYAYSVGNFKEIEDGVLLSGAATSGHSSGLFFFDKETKKITKKHNTTGYGYSVYRQTAGGWLIGSTSDNAPEALFFNTSTRGVTPLTDTGFGFPIFHLYANGQKCLMCNTQGNAYVYSLATGQVEFLAVLPARYNREVAIDGGCFIYHATGTATTFAGCVFFDEASETFTIISADGRGWANVWDVEGGKYFISADNSSSKGLFLFDKNNKSVEVVHTTGYSYSALKKINETFLLSSSSGTHPVFLYSPTEDVVEEIFSGSSLMHFCDVEGGCLIGSNTDTSSNSGVWMYDALSKVATKLTPAATSGARRFFKKVDGGVFIGGSGTYATGIYFYDESTKSATHILKTGSNYMQSAELNDTLYLISTAIDTQTYNTAQNQSIPSLGGVIYGQFVVSGFMVCKPSNNAVKVFSDNYTQSMTSVFDRFICATSPTKLLVGEYTV